MNTEQRKHIANSLRIIGMAQFAAYGYLGLQENDWLQVTVSALTYLGLEAFSIKVLGNGGERHAQL